MDTSELAAAYRAVLELAAAPGAGPRADPAGGRSDPGADGGEGPWRAQDVLAHLVLNDRLLTRAVRSVLDGAAQGDTQLAARIVDGEETRVDQPMPVAGLLTIQARVHLPMHERQLGELLGRP
jgi:hypothetical protein